MRNFLLIFSVFCFSCKSHNSTDTADSLSMARYIDSMITNVDTLYVDKMKTELFYNMIQKHRDSNKHQYGLIYILDAECSACIGDLFEFVQIVQKLKNEIPVYVVVDNENIPVVNYYLEKVNLDYPHLSFHDNVLYQYFIDIKEDSRRIFIINEDKIANSFFL